jgi:large subunit ribosomal protein L29
VTTVRARQLRTLTREELEQRLREAREELFNLKFQHKTGQLGNPLRIREVRKDIARLITVLEEGQVAGERVSEATPADAQPATGE